MITNTEARDFVTFEILKAAFKTKAVNSNKSGTILTRQGRIGQELAIYGSQVSIIRFNEMHKRDVGYTSGGDVYGFYVNGVLQHEGHASDELAMVLLPLVEG